MNPRTFPFIDALMNDLKHQGCCRTVTITPRTGPELRKELELLLRDKATLDRCQELFGEQIPGGNYREHLAKLVNGL